MLKTILSVVIFFIFPTINSIAQSYNAYLDSIDCCFKEKNWSRAEQLLLDVLNKEPGNPNNYLLLSNLGTVRRNLGKQKEALDSYNAAHGIAPKAVTILHNRASLFLEMDSVNRALSDYELILSLDPKDAHASYSCGMIALEYGDFEVSKQYLEKALVLAPNDVNAQRGLAIWEKLNGNIQRAITLYTELINKDHNIANYTGRAECYLAIEALTEAEKDILEAQKLDPENNSIYVLKANLAELQFRYDDAVSYAEKALSLGADPELVKRFLKKKPL